MGFLEKREGKARLFTDVTADPKPADEDKQRMPI